MKSYLQNSFLPAVIYSAGTFIFLILPGKSIPGFSWAVRFHFDKWIHAIMFFLLALIWAIVFSRKETVSKKALLYKIFCIVVIYGFIMELIQHYFIQGRSFDVLDIMANTFGASLAILFFKKG